MSECARIGCTRQAKGDEYCSRDCFIKRDEVRDIDNEKREAANRRRRIKRLAQKHGPAVTLTNPDAAAHVADGQMVFGKLHMHSSETDR